MNLRSICTTALLPLLLTACSEPPQVHGTVTTAWGKPIEGATVQLEGTVEQQTTDATGTFSFELEGEGSRRIMAGRDGYIRNQITVEPVPDQPIPDQTIALFPEPQQPGFYALNLKTADHLLAMPVETKGTEIRAYTGMPDVGQLEVRGQGPQRFLFSSTLRSSELARMDIQLHKLKFIDKTEVPGVLGAEPVAINLWVVDEAVQFDLKGLPSKDDYLITTREHLPRGVYAFHTQGVLTSKDVDALENIPKEMRVAYPFEVK